MKKFKIFSIILISLILVGTLSSFNAMNSVSAKSISINEYKTLYVAMNGTDRNDGLTITKAKRNIQNAINAANAGDTIRIGPGIYNDVPLEINKNIALKGTAQTLPLLMQNN